MNRTEYRKTRDLIRGNGYYALRWMSEENAKVWTKIQSMEKEHDILEWRQLWIKRSTHYASNANIIKLTSII